ncbi:MAG: hypothetical protein ACHWZW_00850 [Spirulina sp.]
MKTSYPLLVTLTVLGLSSAALPAWAGSTLEPPVAVSMTDVVQSTPHSADHLNHLAGRIQRRMAATDNPEAMSTLDFQQIPLVGDLLDEDGNLNLPLGLTIYNTMGDTSIGFGSEF